MKKIIDSLNWRYAVKVFDQNKKLSEEQVLDILETARLSPSSFGLQAWGFVRVKNTEKREMLKEVAWGQTQITTSSDLIVLCIKSSIDDSTVDKYIKDIAMQRDVIPEELAGFSNMITKSVMDLNPEERSAWAKRQVYIALGIMMTACAAEGIDTCPMEGFDNQKFDEILGLEKLGLKSTVLLAIGYRDISDNMSLQKKVRFDRKDVIFEI
jgi:nitroreductase / dihydropteridine reductase